MCGVQAETDLVEDDEDCREALRLIAHIDRHSVLDPAAGQVAKREVEVL